MHAGHGRGPAAEEMTRRPRHSLQTGEGEEVLEERGHVDAGQGVEEEEEVCEEEEEVGCASPSFGATLGASFDSTEQWNELLSLFFFCRK
jgi:hypothetical protein